MRFLSLPEALPSDDIRLFEFGETDGLAVYYMCDINDEGDAAYKAGVEDREGQAYARNGEVIGTVGDCRDKVIRSCGSWGGTVHRRHLAGGRRGGPAYLKYATDGYHDIFEGHVNT